MKNLPEQLLSAAFGILGDTVRQEYTSKALVDRWQLIEQIGNVLLIISVLGAGVTGTGTIWFDVSWSIAWAILTAYAAAFSLINLAISTSTNVREQSELYTGFSVLRREIEKFRSDLLLWLSEYAENPNSDKGEREFQRLKKQYDDLATRLIALAKRAAERHIGYIYTDQLDRKAAGQCEQFMREHSYVSSQTQTYTERATAVRVISDTPPSD